MKRQKKIIVLFTVFLHLGYMIPLVNVLYFLPADQRSTDVGIWYSTWYAKVPSIPLTWISDFGVNSTNQFLSDLDLDGMDDAVTFYGTNGSPS